MKIIITNNMIANINRGCKITFHNIIATLLWPSQPPSHQGAERRQPGSKASQVLFCKTFREKRKTVIQMCVGLCSYILRPSESSISKLWDNFNLFWNFEHTLSSYSMHTDNLTLCTQIVLLLCTCTSILYFEHTDILILYAHTHRGRAALLESALQDTLGRFTVKLPSWKELIARFSKSDL